MTESVCYYILRFISLATYVSSFNLHPKLFEDFHPFKFLATYFKYSVIQKDGLNFVSLYFKIRTSDNYDVNCI